MQSSIDYVGVTGSTGGECHGSGVSIMPDIPDNLSVEEQMQILEDITNREYENEQQKANAARYLRTIMRNTKKFNLDGLFNLDGNEIFMNETLRDFLNTSDSGDQYNLNIIKKEINNPSSGWYWEPADSEHQDGVPNKDNKKYVNKKDGREVVFDKYGNVVNDKVNKGTYNFGTIHSGIAHCVDWTSFSEHGRWDMDPYFRQFGKNPIYRSVFGHWYYSFEYGNQENLLRNYYEHH